MTPERKHDLADLYRLYEGRCPVLDSSSVQKVDLKIERKSLVNLVTGPMSKIAKDYDAVNKGDAENTIENGRWGDGESRTVYNATSPQNESIAFSVRKSFRRIHDDVQDDAGTYPPHPAGEESESIFFELYNGATEIGGYRLDRGMAQTARHEWALNDRLVLDEYREQGFGGALLAATESFAQHRANLEATPQKLTANVGQPSVLFMLLNKGFVARSEEDQKRIDMVLSADPNLELDHAVVKRENDEWEPQKYKDPYVFTKGTILKSEVNALRINLEKTFQPKVGPVETDISAARGRILDVSTVK